VDGFVELVVANAPIVNPLPTEFRLLLVADNFRDVFSIVSCGFESAEYGAPGRTSSENGDSLFLDRLC
jgi:hypothetical protein